ncbi:EscU/YscU/HrcU family type III secretion system export apparatus switch protein [Archangium lansingense]|jgi:flagellar biosynthetic protein FlhB/flagellar biosynthesis protein|uniref:EscU/YscU/HrcU family type III secretion system export apparatus switch protein n=1 Tax=Archangium lansingense TaxID=2995310 RepID=A0ABT4A3P6_9BACT|nr:EscU/YscU/HrcU family type III secretion system export apparatus switch protein [Archangium lansinium]MCY1076241.1 EscU/YscU/HrcU family type III secretion system export apparatus switch protein [Archangium lansinium]
MSDDAEMAIAIKYDKEKDTAPRVVAKGMRLKADKIREIAKQYNIPVMKNVSLANALYRIDVGQEIPEELYDAVAEVLNFIFELQREQQAGGKR